MDRGMGGQEGGRMDGRMDGQTDGRTDGWTDEWMEGWTNGCKGGQRAVWGGGYTGRKLNGQIDGGMDRQNDERVGRQTVGWTDRRAQPGAHTIAHPLPPASVSPLTTPLPKRLTPLRGSPSPTQGPTTPSPPTPPAAPGPNPAQAALPRRSPPGCLWGHVVGGAVQPQMVAAGHLPGADDSQQSHVFPG